MTTVRAPRTLAAATALLERFAELDGQVAALEGRRSRMIARANAAIDARLVPLLEERSAISEKAEPWWATAKAELLAKDRKSIELGGCNIGTRSSREALAHSFESDKKAAVALRDTRYAKQTTRVEYALERAPTLKLLQAGGKTSAALIELGFRIAPSKETFFLERVKQSGTVGV
jgi:hypothetical protein